jgi:hypothetical protein
VSTKTNDPGALIQEWVPSSLADAIRTGAEHELDVALCRCSATWREHFAGLPVFRPITDKQSNDFRPKGESPDVE